MLGSEFAALRAFSAVAERASFARAAEHLRIAPSTLSQTVRALEERLGITLLIRTTRRVSLTSAGAQLLARFAPALREMEAAVTEAHDGRSRPSGTVRLHTPWPAYNLHLEPMLGALRRALPDVMLELTIDDELADITGDHDLVIRRTEFIDSGMVTLGLGGDIRHSVVAAPEYLAAFGAPAVPEDLADHRCIRWRRPATTEIERWRFEVEDASLTVVIMGPLIVSHCAAAIAAAVQGVGIAYVLESYSATSIADGTLKPLLIDFLPTFGGWQLCLPKQARPSAATKAIIELLVNNSAGKA